MLSDVQIRRSTCPPDRKFVRLSDSEGLYLQITPTGSRRWFWKYRIAGKEKALALGPYPAVTLAAARAARNAARDVLQRGVDPVAQRQAEKAAAIKAAPVLETFETLAREFHRMRSADWSDKHAVTWLGRMQRYVFPTLGSRSPHDITAADVLATLRQVEAKGRHDTTRILRESIGQVFRYGIADGRSSGNPAADIVDALQTTIVEHHAAVLDPSGVADLMRAIYDYAGQPLTRAALIISALTFQRPGNVRAMEWSELDLDRGMWTIPGEKMKRTKQAKISGRPHRVPLARQAIAAIRAVDPGKDARHSVYVFPALTGGSRPMSENTVNMALRRLGYDRQTMTAHGFRAMARTVMVENIHGVDPEVIEVQLAHGKSGPLGSAYDRAEYMTRRVELMQTWADYLDDLRVFRK